MAQVIGLGGVFLKFKDSKGMRTWYQDILGIICNDYGVLFEFGGPETTKGYLQLGTFDDDSTYFGKESQQYMLNFRVDDLQQLHIQLVKNNVEIVDEIETYSYGKFLHILDPEGNRIELWEAIDQNFTENESSVMPMR